MKNTFDNFGNKIEVGDYVFYGSHRDKADYGVNRNGVMTRGKVVKFSKKSVFIESSYPSMPMTLMKHISVPIDCVVRDNSDIISDLQDRDRFLSCLEAAGVDNWSAYDIAQSMYDGEDV